MTWHSGLFSRMPSAMSRRRMVLPVRGGATIRPRVPLPIGQKRSTARVVIRPSFISSLRCLSGETVVSEAKSSMVRRSSRAMPSTVSMKRIFGLGKRPSGGKAVPPISEPAFSLKRRMSSFGTKVSVGRRLPFFAMSSSWPLPPFVTSMSRMPSTRIVLSTGGAAGARRGAAAAAGGSTGSVGGAAGCSAGAERDFFSIQNEDKVAPALDAQNSRGDKCRAFERP